MLIEIIDLHDSAILEKYVESQKDNTIILTERQIERVKNVIEKIRGFYEKQS